MNKNTTTPTSGADGLPAMVSKALREAYNLGQRYWQQADSEYISQHKKADDTRAKFLALVEETCAALAAGQATAAPAQPAAQQGVAYAALPDAPLSVFSKGPWVFKETGQDFSEAELDEAAFVAYREHASHGQAPAGANENAKLVTLIAKCRDAFPIPAHGDPIENYWSAAIEDPSNVPAYLQEIAKRKQADSVQEDAAREAIEKVLALFPFNALIQKFSVNNGPCLTADNDDEFYSVKRVLAFLTEIKTTLDIARKQGENHD